MTTDATTAFGGAREAVRLPAIVVGLLLCGALAAACLLSVMVGTQSLSPATVLDALAHPSSASRATEIVWDLRLPRTLLGVAVAVGLGAGGALMQAVTRNPIADPGLLGINAGAAAAVAVGISVLGVASLGGYLVLGFVGACLALVLVHGLAARGGTATPVRLVLAGTAVSASLLAVVTGISLLDPGAFDTLRAWEVGSLSGRSESRAVPVAIVIAIAAIGALVLARALNALALGDDAGRALGAHVQRVRALTFIAIALLCGSATAAVGPIGFIGLTVPHIARAVFRTTDNRLVLAGSILIAPCLMLPADVIGRVVDRPGEIQVGVIVAIIGAPAFIWLVRRRAIGSLAPPGDGGAATVRSADGGTRRERTAIVCAALVAAALAVSLYSIGSGEAPIAPRQVISTLLGGGDDGTRFIIETLRLPRVLCALLVGAGLALSGAVFQSLTRNPLGSPDIIGFTWGAALAAVLAIVLLSGGVAVVAGSAIVGGTITAILVYLLGRATVRSGGSTGARLILVGVGISAMLAAITSFVLARADLGAAQGARIWLTGSLNGRGWEQVIALAIGLAIFVPMLAALARPLRMLMIGDDGAHALGVNVSRTRVAVILVAVAISGIATAAAGPIPFIALAAPQIARRLTRDPGLNLIASAITGALLLAAADLAAQRLLPSGGLPVGIMTGAIGGIYLIWLLDREMRGRRP